MESQVKRCSSCKQKKSIDQFHRNSAKSDGLQNFCKQCDNAYHSKRSKTAEGKNQPARRKAWAESTFKGLGLSDADY
jgi:hypothetical protein